MSEPTPIPIRHDWRDDEIRALHDLPLPELVFRAQAAHRASPTRSPDTETLARATRCKTSRTGIRPFRVGRRERRL